MFKKFFPVGYIILLGACSKTEMNQPSADQHYDDAEFHTAALIFSGYTWQVRNTANIISGPGGNYFSKKPSMVFVDENGDLHLNIKKINNKWRCSEVYLTATTGYGKYIFVTKGELETYNEKIVAGLFTWDNFSFTSDANSELDIEFAQWGNPAENIYTAYTVQPSRGGTYAERYDKPAENLTYDENGYTTHIINWQPDEIIFELHTGDDTSAATLLHQFIFDNTNPARTALESGSESDPVIIPTPQSDTRPHINFWLFDENGNGKGDLPTDGLPAEFIVHRFEYIPM